MPRIRSGKSKNEESDEFDQSFTVREVKENLRTIGEKFLMWIIVGFDSEKTDRMREMASTVRQIRHFLIDRKRRVEQSKSLRQLKQLETLSPLLDSANYLTSVAEDYFAKVDESQEKENKEVLEREEVTAHDNSFVDMFLDETQENRGNSTSQKDTYSQSVKATTSKSILKTSTSETAGVQKKISFAKTATNVYEDNETSQISLAKSSGSVKSADDPTAQNLHAAIASTSSASDITGAPIGVQESARQASEDMFDDTESIIDTSFQEDAFSPVKSKNFKLFKAKNLAKNNIGESEEKSGINAANVEDDAQKIESDPLLSQEYQIDAGETKKCPKTVPFHNFVLTLPQESSGSEASLDARVNMAINLVNMKPREPEMAPQVRPDKMATPQDSTDGIVQSTLTCTDFRWMEPIEYNRRTSEGSWLEDLNAPKPPLSVFEEAIYNRSLRPTLDTRNETRMPETNFFQQQNHPQTESFPPKPTWSNPFPSTAHTSTIRHAQATAPEAGKKQDEEPNTEKESNLEVPSKPLQEQPKRSITRSNDSRRSQNKQKSVKRSKTKNSQGTQKPPEIAAVFHETYDSHKTAIHRPQQTLKKTPKDAVLSAKTPIPADEQRMHDSSNAAATMKPAGTTEASEDSSKIARLRQFGMLWSNPSSASLQDTEINTARTKSNPNSSEGRPQATTKRQPRGKTKSSQGCLSLTTKGKELDKLDSGKGINSVPVQHTMQQTTFPSSTPLQDTVLAVRNQPQNQRKPATQQKPAKTKQSQSKAAESARLTQLKAELEMPKASRVHQEFNVNVNTTMLENCSSGLEETQSQKVTKKARGRPKKLDNERNTPKKVNKSSNKSTSTSTSHFELQPAHWLENSLNSKSSVSHQQALQSSNQDSHQAHQSQFNTNINFQQAQACWPSSKPELHQQQSLNSKQDSEPTGFLKFQPLQVPKTFVELQPAVRSRNFPRDSGNMFQSNWQQEVTNLPSFMPDSAQAGVGFNKPHQIQGTTEPFKHQSANPVDASIGDATYAQTPAQNEPCNLQQYGQFSATLNTSIGREDVDASFFEMQPNNTSHSINQLVNPSDVAAIDDGQNIRTSWQFNFPAASGIEQQNASSRNALSQATYLKWMHPAVDGNYGGSGEMEGRARPTTQSGFPPMNPAVQQGTARNQKNKRAGQEGAQQFQAPKIMKLQEKDANIEQPLGTQGTEVLYQECENLFWAQDNLPNWQNFNSQMIDTAMFDSQNVVLSQNADLAAMKQNSQPAVSQGSLNEEQLFQYEAHTHLSRGYIGENPPSFQEPTRPESSERHDFVSSTEHAENARPTNLHEDYGNTHLTQDPTRNSEIVQSTYQPPYTEFEQGVQVSSTELAGNDQPQANIVDDESPEKTVEEEIEELINGIEWIRAIPESELIEAANIDELINDQAFLW